MLRPHLALIAALAVLAGPAAAAECRAPEAIRGAKAAAQPGCPTRTRPAPSPQDEAARAGRTPGFVDLGNGVELRVSGRVRADTILRR